MMIKKQFMMLLCLAILTQVSVNVQELLSPSMTFSHKKTAYVTLKSGKEIKGLIKDIDRKKGLVEYNECE